MLVLEGLVGLHRTVQLQLLQHYWLGHRHSTVILNSLPWKWIKIIILLLRLHPSISFCSVPFTVMTTPISSKGFLFTVVDIVVIWFNSSIPVYFTSLIPKTSKFTFVTFCLTMSNLPWFRNLTFQVSMQYVFTASNFCFHQQIHLQLSVILLWSSHFILSGAISDCPLLLPTQCHFGHILTWGAHLPVSYLFTFLYCSWGSWSKNTDMVYHSLLQWTTYF